MSGHGLPERLPRRLRIAGALVVTGLAVECATLVWPHPTAFLAFALGGGTLIAAGIVIYLWSLVS